MSRMFLSILPYLVAAVCGFVGAWSLQELRAEARISRIELAHRAASEAAALGAAAVLQAAAVRAAAVARAAATRETVLTAQQQESRDAIKTATTSRPCLGGTALRVLGQSPGLSLGVKLPSDPGASTGTAAAAATVAEDGADGTESEYASEAQVADWIAVAGTQYERCRGRIDDIAAVAPQPGTD
jgi:hypothetical protein